MYTDGPKTATLSGHDATFIKASVVTGASLLSAASATPTGSSSGMKTAVSGSRGSGPAHTGAAAAPANKGAAARFGVEVSALFALAAVTVLNFL